MSKHTPGPWEYIPDDGDHCGVIKAATGWVCDLVDPPSQQDAVLMAAAPELLEALEFLVFAFESGDKTFYVDGHGFIDTEALKENARQAITKAKGE